MQPTDLRVLWFVLTPWLLLVELTIWSLAGPQFCWVSNATRNMISGTTFH